MVTREEFLDVREAWKRGKSISAIARETGRDRKTIRRLLRDGEPPPRALRRVASKLDPFRDYLVDRMLGPDKVSNASVLFDEIREQGYEGGLSILWEFLKPLRPLVAEKATVRFETPPGRHGQVDWGLQEAGPETGPGLRAHPGLVARQLPRLQRHSSPASVQPVG